MRYRIAFGITVLSMREYTGNILVYRRGRQNATNLWYRAHKKIQHFSVTQAGLLGLVKNDNESWDWVLLDATERILLDHLQVHLVPHQVPGHK